MCGITAIYGEKQAQKFLEKSLKRLEYRGYDSAGIAIMKNSKIRIEKDTGKLEEISQKTNWKKQKGKIGIGHVRWATHGDVTKQNAHPHTSCDDRFAIVHNGIIENWKELKNKLSNHKYTSKTDSEVIAHFLEEKTQGENVEKAIQKFLQKAKGSFAVVALDSKTGKMYAFKRESPLALGIGKNQTFLASDIYAFSNETEQAIFFEDEEYAIIKKEKHEFKNLQGEKITKTPKKFEWNQKTSKKQEYEHYMRKEIEEIPKALKTLKKSLKHEQKHQLQKTTEKIQKTDKIMFTASGTSYHASLLGVYLLQKQNINSQTLIASEFKNFERVDENTLLMPISQSGETKDVLEAIKYSKKRNAKTASLINVPHSTIERETDNTLRIKAGQEICVAATKTFTNQLYLLNKIANKLGTETKLQKLPKNIQKTIEKNEPKIKKLAKNLSDKKDIYIIGRGNTYPIAREIALKLKEISYIHAEGMMAGELKHGTLALVEEDTPVISLIPEKDSEIMSNVHEVEARGAKSIKISPYHDQFQLPKNKDEFPFHSTILGFLLAYWIGREKNLPIDKPRNLAKSVTVK